jgi:hypothetical protein
MSRASDAAFNGRGNDVSRSRAASPGQVSLRDKPPSRQNIVHNVWGEDERRYGGATSSSGKSWRDGLNVQKPKQK